MGKKPVLRWVGTFWFGLSLAGSGCESCSNNAKRTFNPTPTISRNTSTPVAPGGTTATSATATTAGTGADGTSGGFALQPKSTGIQPISATDDPSARGATSRLPVNDLRIQPVKETSNRVTDTALDPYPAARTSTLPSDGLQISNPRSDATPVLPPPPSSRGIAVSGLAPAPAPAPSPPSPPPPPPTAGLPLPPVGNGQDLALPSK